MEFKRIFSKKLILLFIFITLISAVMYYKEQVKITDIVVESDTDSIDDNIQSSVKQSTSENSGQSNSIEGLNIRSDFDNTEIYSYYNLMLVDYRLHVPELGTEIAAKQALIKYSSFINLYIKMKNNADEYSKALERTKNSNQSYYEEYINYVNNNEQVLIKLYEDKNIISTARNQLISNEQYARTYNDTIKAKRGQVDQLMKNALYSGQSSFSRINILKARYDMKQLETITPEVGNGKAVETVFDYDFINFLLLILIIATIYSFFDERKKGLWSIIHNSAGGRYRLTLIRTGILFVLSVLYTFVMYCVVLVTAFKLYGGFEDIRQLIQSSSQYNVVLLVMSRWKFILIYLIAHSICLFAIGMVVWLILSIIKNTSVSMLVAGLIFALEYILYAIVPANSALCFFKFVNLFQLISPQYSFTHYLNWGYGTFISDIFTSTAIFTGVLIPISIIVNTFINGFKRPIEQVGLIEKVLTSISCQISKGVEKLPTFLKEIYKILIIQKGIVIIAVAIWLVLDNPIARGVMYDDVKTEMSNFYVQVEGAVPGNQANSIIKEKEDELADLIANHNTTNEEKQLINTKRIVLDNIKKDTDYLTDLKESRDIDGEYINPYVYNDVLGIRIAANQRNVGTIAVFVEILLLFGIFSFERKQSMVPVLRSSGGRAKFWRFKVLSIFAVTTAIWATFYGLNGWNITRIYTFNSLSVPLQSLQIMCDFPIEMSIGTFLIILYIYKFILLLSVGFIVMAISLKIDYFKAMIISCILLIPHILYILGIKICYLTSVVIPIGFIEYWSQYGNNYRSYITAFVILLLGIVAYLITRIQWNRTR